MGEYVTVTVYKEMKPLSFLSERFNEICWELYEVKGDKEATEQIYRKIGFVHENGMIFDLMMEFLEKEGKVYQTNQGILGMKQLPNLSLHYKFVFPDFWLSMLKPEEMIMNKYNFIDVEMTAATIQERFAEIEQANKNNPTFKNSLTYKHYYTGIQSYPAIKSLINGNEIVRLNVGHIYHTGKRNYRDEARTGITEQRKEIASQFIIPYWAKKTPR